MANLILVGGEKGGVGKSFVCRTLVQYHIDTEKEFTVFDSDRSNPDILRIYGESCGVRVAVFSEAQRFEDAANQIYNAALAQRVIVNLPAQVFIPIRQWFENNELLTIAKDDGVKFQYWFVSDGGYDSLKLFRKSLEYFQNRVPHVLVKNLGQCDDWEPLDDDEDLQLLIKRHKAKIIEFPKFIGNTDRNRIDDKSLTFGEARDHQDFSSIGKQRVKRFLRESYETFNELGIL